VITRVIDWWRHDFAGRSVVVQMTITDSVEGTTATKHVNYADAVLPPEIVTWEAASAAGLGATLAVPMVRP